MGAPRVTNRVRDEYEQILLKQGEEKVYRHALGSGAINVENHQFPEIVILNQAEAFFSLYRQTGNQNYFIIGKALRRAAHKLYRQLIKSYEDYPVNMRFLNVIR